MQRRPRVVSLLVGAALLSACGTTVPVTSQSQLQSGDGLGLQGVTQQPVATLPGGGAPLGADPGSVPTAGASRPGRAVPTRPAHVAGPRTTTPLSIGVVLTGTSNAQSFGVSLGNTLSERDVDQAVIDALNAQGGLAGRRIAPVFASTDTGSSNWETDFSRACATFTQDHHVAAVLGYVFNYFASFERCLAAKGIPHLSTGFNVPDRKELSRFPLELNLDVPTIDRRGLLKLEGAHADGILTANNRLGILTDSCPGSASSYRDVFLPAARQLGLTVAKTVTISCPNGNADTAGAVRAIQSAVLQFASARIDRVILHASSEGPGLLLFALSAESQGYHPTYVVSSLANLEALRSNVPSGQVHNIHGYGWMPTQDVPPRNYPKPNALQQRCLTLLGAKGLRPGTGPDFYYAYNFCEALFVYERALRLTNGESSGPRVLAAVTSLGTSFASLTNQGGSSFAPGRPDAPRSMRHLVYRSDCSCFGYTGPTRAIPTS